MDLPDMDWWRQLFFQSEPNFEGRLKKRLDHGECGIRVDWITKGHGSDSLPLVPGVRCYDSRTLINESYFRNCFKRSVVAKRERRYGCLVDIDNLTRQLTGSIWLYWRDRQPEHKNFPEELYHHSGIVWQRITIDSWIWRVKDRGWLK